MLGDPLTDDCTWFLAAARGEKSGPRLVGLCRELHMQHATLISNTDRCISVFQYGGDAKDMNPEDSLAVEENLNTFNAAQNAVETVHSKVTRQRISIMPLTTGGGYLERQRAKKMGNAIEGVLDDNEMDAIEDDIVLDALTTDHGAGAVLVLECEDSIKLQHVPIEDVWYDSAETRHRKPSCCYHVPRDGVDLYKLLELYANPKDEGMPGLVGTWQTRREAIIRAANKAESWRRMRSNTTQRRVDVFQAWHLPSGDVDDEYEDEETGEKKQRHDGRHVVAVEGEDGTLVDEPWAESHFPILMYVPRKRRRTIWGLSLMRDLIAPQREYEKLTVKIQDQHQKMGVSGFAASTQSNVNVREITAGTHGAGFVVEFDGQTPPTPLVVEPVATGTYGYAESIPRNMLERNGISTMAAASQLPAGLQQASGKALQVFEDFEDTRLMPYHRERERFKVALSWIIVCAAARIVDRKGSYVSRYRGKKGIEKIDWKDILMDREDFVLKVFPISALSKHPAAKFAQLNDLLNAGAITPEQFKRLFEIPDLEAENDIDTADTDVIDRALDIMVTTGRYMSPEPFDDLELAVTRAGKFYNVCRQQEVPEARLQLLRDYMTDAKSLIAQKAPPHGAAPPMPMPPPMGGPPGMALPEGPLPGMPPAPPPAPPMPMAA